MRRGFVRALSLLLVLAMVFAMTAAAAEPDEGGEPTDEELIAAYGIPSGWSQPALLFAVRNGLLYGKEDGMLHPTDSTTRAELASIVMRVLRTQAQADLSGFSDVKQGSWYAEPMAKAVAVGIFTGDSQNRLNPNGVITREQAFSVLARAFGVTGGTQEDLYAYPDWMQVSDWARNDVGAMVKAGYVGGNGQGELSPSATLSRQELAQVLYNILDSIVAEVPTEATGNVAASTDSVQPGTVIQGDLLLTGDSQEINLTDVTVKGRLIVQGCSEGILRLRNCTVESLVLCRQMKVYLYDAVKQVVVTKSGTTVIGSCDTLELWADAKLQGLAEGLIQQTDSEPADSLGALGVETEQIKGFASLVKIYSGHFTLSWSATADTINAFFPAAGQTVTVNGSAGTLNLQARNITVGGDGKIGTVNVGRTGSKVACDSDVMNNDAATSLSALSIRRTDTSIPSKDTPTATIAVTFSNVGAGSRKAYLVWYIGDQVYARNKNVTLTEGAKVTCWADFSRFVEKDTPAQIRLAVYCEGESRSTSFTVEIAGSVYEQAKLVRTENVQATVRSTVKLYKSHNGSSLLNYIGTVPAGTQVTYETYYSRQFARIRLSNGTVGWVKYSDISISNGVFWTDKDYSKEVKECWVNEVKGYSSASKYLIWISLYTQRVNVFQGSKGSWKLIYSWRASTGKNTTPTLVQNTTIRYKTPKWNFGSYYVHHVSVIDGAGRAFHSRTYSTYNDALLDGTIGTPVSHGCIRMMDEACTWIYDNAPVGTAVVVY